MNLPGGAFFSVEDVYIRFLSWYKFVKDHFLFIILMAWQAVVSVIVNTPGSNL